MNKLSTAFGYKFLCVLQPVVGNHEQYRFFRQTVKADLMKKQVRVLDLEETQLVTDDMFLDRVHATAAGHRMMAEIVAERIIRDRLLPIEGVREVRPHHNAAITSVARTPSVPAVH